MTHAKKIDDIFDAYDQQRNRRMIGNAFGAADEIVRYLRENGYTDDQIVKCLKDLARSYDAAGCPELGRVTREKVSEIAREKGL